VPKAKSAVGKAARYRISLRLDAKHEELLRRLEAAVGHSRNELLREALCHFYWTVLEKGQAAWIYLPPDLSGIGRVDDEKQAPRRRQRAAESLPTGGKVARGR